MPIFFSRSPICGPPPWTITGFMPTSFSITTSRAKPAFSSGSVIALPPYLMTMTLSWKRWMYGSASARICAFRAALTASRGMAEGTETRLGRAPEGPATIVPERGPAKSGTRNGPARMRPRASEP